MKICAAQLHSTIGEIEKNIQKHLQLIKLAASKSADLIFFPELSITGYEPKLAEELAMSHDDRLFDIFQEISDEKKISIAIGMPTKSDSGIHISMIIFQPGKPRQTYSKQILWHEELPFFVAGNKQIFLQTGENKIAPAICYESLQPQHYESAFKSGAHIYLASVAKDAESVTRTYQRSPAIAKEFSATIMMSNCVGRGDNFIGAGQSAVWNKNGELAGQLNETDEGILIFDTETEEIFGLSL